MSRRSLLLGRVSRLIDLIDLIDGVARLSARFVAAKRRLVMPERGSGVSTSLDFADGRPDFLADDGPDLLAEGSGLRRLALLAGFAAVTVLAVYGRRALQRDVIEP